MKKWKKSDRNEWIDIAKCRRLTPHNKFCDDYVGGTAVERWKGRWKWPWTSAFSYRSAWYLHNHKI